MRKIGHVGNPLTLIAIFAGVTEAMGVGIIPFLQSEALGILLLLFLSYFALLLVCLFFSVLWFRPVNLYAPSDWDNGARAERMLRHLTPSQWREVTFKKIEEVATMPGEIELTPRLRSALRRQSIVEDMMIRSLERKVGPLSRGVAYGPGEGVAFDAGNDVAGICVVEFDVNLSGPVTAHSVESRVGRLTTKISQAFAGSAPPSRAIVAFAGRGREQNVLTQGWRDMGTYKVQMIYFDIAGLEEDFGLSVDEL